MPEEQEPKVETTITPAGEMPTGDAPNAEKLQAELEKVRAALKSANNEAADRRKKLDAFETAERERADAEKTELERAQAALAEMESKAVAAQALYARAQIENAVRFAAQGLGFYRPDDAIALLDLSALELTDKGEVKGVDAALKALTTERPYLVKAAMPNDPDARKRNPPDSQTRIAEQKATNALYGIRDRALT